VRTRNVMENIWMGRVPCRRGFWVDRKKMHADTAALFQDLEIDINPARMVSELSVAQCQLLEIARAVSFNAKVIIMDEPTSSLTETETHLLFKIINKLIAQGVAIIYISHKIEEVLEISHEVSIMRDGRMIGTYPASELSPDAIIKGMVGREMTSRFPPHDRHPGRVYLEARGITSAESGSFVDASFTLRRGEILGVGGLMGSQRTELMESLFGLRPLAAGAFFIDGKPVAITAPPKAIKNNLALLTEDRRATGIVPMLSVLENTVMANQTARPQVYRSGSFLGRLFLDNKKRRADAEKYVEVLSIKTPGVKQQIQYLSGGNQQKVLLGRWMLTDPDILILDEPTRGIDVGAKYEIYTLMENLVQEGKSVIMISSEMPELLGMSDRVLVMCEGHLSAILDAKDATGEEVMYYASTWTGKTVSTATDTTEGEVNHAE
jgi:methyl-galactoside transport system ATP-binding protein